MMEPIADDRDPEELDRLNDEAWGEPTGHHETFLEYEDLYKNKENNK